jgi:hypothetical protein
MAVGFTRLAARPKLPVDARAVIEAVARIHTSNPNHELQR